MFAGMARGWELTKASFQVLKLDKEILALPVLSGLLSILLFASVVTGVVGLSTTGALEGDSAALAWFGIVFVTYVLLYFIIIYFNAAVVECATIRFNGGDPVVKDGLRKAWSRKGKIFQWAIVAATVGLILKVLDSLARQSENDFGRIAGQIAVSIVGAAWSIATFFVMPVLVYQDIGPFQAMRQSITIVKRTWREGLGAVGSTGILFFLLGLLGLVPAFIGMAVGGVLGLVFFGVTVLYWVALWVTQTAVNGIVVAALYKYAVDGEVPRAFAGTAAVASSPAYYA